MKRHFNAIFESNSTPEYGNLLALMALTLTCCVFTDETQQLSYYRVKFSR